MNTFYKFLFLIGAFLPMINTRHAQFFRKDYIYIAKFDGFYKLHWNLSGVSWNAAFLACDGEEASLFYPKFKDEWMLAKNLTSKMAEPPNVTEIFVGLHDEFGVGEFITVDGHSTSSPLFADESIQDVSEIRATQPRCVTMNTETGIFQEADCFRVDEPLPFICKKTDDESCPTIDPGYKYEKEAKKCYKVNNKKKTWDNAMQTCYMEGGLLAVLENKQQAEALAGRLTRYSSYFVGVRKMFSMDTYSTVKGQRFDDLYQRFTDYNEPKYDCGAIRRDDEIYTTSYDCENKYAFICEMEV